MVRAQRPGRNAKGAGNMVRNDVVQRVLLIANGLVTASPSTLGGVSREKAIRAALEVAVAAVEDFEYRLSNTEFQVTRDEFAACGKASAAWKLP